MPTDTEAWSGAQDEAEHEETPRYQPERFRDADPTDEPAGDSQEILDAFLDPNQEPASKWNSVQIVGTDGTGESGTWHRSWENFAQAQGDTEEDGPVMRAMGFAKDLGRPHEIWSVDLGVAILGQTQEGKAQDARFDAVAERAITQSHANRLTGRPDSSPEEFTHEQQAAIQSALDAVRNARARNNPTETAAARWAEKSPDDWEETLRALQSVTEHGTTLGKHLTMVGIINQDGDLIETGRAIMTDAVRRGSNSLHEQDGPNLNHLTALWNGASPQEDPATAGAAPVRYTAALAETFDPTNAGGDHSTLFNAENAVAHDISDLASITRTATRGDAASDRHLRNVSDALCDSRYRHRTTDNPAENAITAIQQNNPIAAGEKYTEMTRVAAEIGKLAQDARAAEGYLDEQSREQIRSIQGEIAQITGRETDPQTAAEAVRETAMQLSPPRDTLDQWLRKLAHDHLEVAATRTATGEGNPAENNYGFQSNPAGYHVRQAAEIEALRTFRNDAQNQD